MEGSFVAAEGFADVVEEIESVILEIMCRFLF